MESPQKGLDESVVKFQDCPKKRGEKRVRSIHDFDEFCNYYRFVSVTPKFGLPHIMQVNIIVIMSVEVFLIVIADLNNVHDGEFEAVMGRYKP